MRSRGNKEKAAKVLGPEVLNVKPFKAWVDKSDTTSFASEQRELRNTWPTGLKFQLLVLAVIFLGFATRYYVIWEPAETVFDEVHFGGFTVSYVTGEYFFDIHPPLGKLFLTAMARFIDYDYSYDQFKEIGQTYPDDKYIYLRCMAAFWGSWLPLLTLLIMKEMKCSFQAGILATAFIMFDGVIVVTSRLILTDSCLWFFGALAIYACLRFWRVQDSGATMASPSWWLNCAFAGVAMGGVVSVKWTGLGMVGMLGIIQIIRAANPLLILIRGSVAQSVDDTDSDDEDDNQKPSADVVITPPPAVLRKQLVTALVGGIFMIAVIFVVYTTTFVLHFQILDRSGPGDVWHDSRFLASLKGTGHTLQPGQSPYTMSEKIIELHKKMFEANSGVEGTHSYGSMWYEWPMMKVGMSYWVKHFPDNLKREVFLGGNLVAYAATTTAVAVLLLYVLSLVHVDDGYSPRQQYYGSTAAWLLFGYILNWLPYITISRVCFIYHYVPSFYLAVLLAGLLLDKYFRHNFDKTAVASVLVFAAAAYWGHQHAYYYGNVDLVQ
eukprot:TRINITY_DN3348_c0_g1_i1.p1 TRINITY_DN3348_c0_g1~~TRINITY_DN3348_c0_g1_i1.p1  ORF type:complete len:550 (+),score=69.63 TRINITY_DN3348_c0_g1_i1:156-1805(+)